MQLNSLNDVATAPNGAAAVRRPVAAPRASSGSTVHDDVLQRQAAVQSRAAAAAIERARDAANQVLAQKGRELAFEFDDELGRVIAKLIDTQTREVIRQVPSEELLAIARALAEGPPAGSLVHDDA